MERHRARKAADAQRAWQLIGSPRRCAIAVTATRRSALDAAVAREPEPRALRAAYACAITIHRDRGEYAAARRISRSMP